MCGDGMYYDKEVDIFQYEEYKDEHKILRERYRKVKTEFMVDIQPYSSEKANRDYGYSIQCTRRMFCDIIPEIKENILIRFNNEFYSIVKIPWDDGYFECLLNKTKDVNYIE